MKKKHHQKLSRTAILAKKEAEREKKGALILRKLLLLFPKQEYGRRRRRRLRSLKNCTLPPFLPASLSEPPCVPKPPVAKKRRGKLVGSRRHISLSPSTPSSYSFFAHLYLGRRLVGAGPIPFLSQPSIGGYERRDR